MATIKIPLSLRARGQAGVNTDQSYEKYAKIDMLYTVLYQ